jgi:NAD(P)-dependent dehydrogenase (short-subunit alcohol dehydrogenase family)
MLLEEKNAVVYGAGGAVGRAVARSFGREGARVFLAGRALAPLEVVAGEITAAGGAAEVAGVDALDEEAVNRHADAVVERAGSIDVSFNAISLGDVQGTPLLEMPLSDFSRPIITGTTTHLLTARAAARHMLERGSGVILTLTASAVRLPDPVMGPPLMGGFGVACTAIESLTMNLAGELGPYGIRVVCLRAEGLPETWRVDTEEAKQFGDLQEFHDLLEGRTLLRRLPTLAEIGNVATFVASDRASAMTATVANVTCGSVVDY